MPPLHALLLPVGLGLLTDGMVGGSVSRSMLMFTSMTWEGDAGDAGGGEYCRSIWKETRRLLKKISRTNSHENRNKWHL